MSKFQAHKDAPDEVWLQIGYGDEGEHTWAPHEIAEDGIEEAGPYVRADRLSGRVAVKALRWPPIGLSRGQRAYGRFSGFDGLEYCIAHYGADVGDAVYRWAPPGGVWSEAFATYEAAKAAAQTDFEARILAAIDTAPTATAREEAVGQEPAAARPDV